MKNTVTNEPRCTCIKFRRREKNGSEWNDVLVYNYACPKHGQDALRKSEEEEWIKDEEEVNGEED